MFVAFDSCDEDEFVFVGHGSQNAIGLESQEIGLDPKKRFYGGIDAETFGKMLISGKFGYNGESNIILYSCSTGKGENNFASRLAKYMSAQLKRKITVTAPTDNIRNTSFGLPFLFGYKLFRSWKTEIKNNGHWQTW